MRPGENFLVGNDDPAWFKQQPRRQTRVRAPSKGEFNSAWQALGMHNHDRRRVLVWRVPKDNPGRKLVPDGLMRIPFLAEADETIENDDRVLLPFLAYLMRGATEVRPTGGFAITGAGAVLGSG